MRFSKPGTFRWGEAFSLMKEIFERRAYVIQFLVHDAAHDNVGVAVVDVKAGQEIEGRDLVSNKTLKAKANMDIPLGHKIALKEFKTGDTVMKYGCDIGRVVAPIKAGDHVHVHNVKTKRWA
jgi:(2R)-sulfolactate sulfo-lyase subunit alpha